MDSEAAQLISLCFVFFSQPQDGMLHGKVQISSLALSFDPLLPAVNLPLNRIAGVFLVQIEKTRVNILTCRTSWSGKYIVKSAAQGVETFDLRCGNKSFGSLVNASRLNNWVCKL